MVLCGLQCRAEKDHGPDSRKKMVEVGPSSSGDPYARHFRQYTVARDLPGPAYAVIADVDRDGNLDIVASSYGPRGAEIHPGRVTLFKRSGGLGTWTSTEIAGEDQGLHFPNKVTIADVDNDGDMDVIVPVGFFICLFGDLECGALVWFEQASGRWIRHDIVPNGSHASFTQARLADIDADGVQDLVTVAEERNPDGSGDLVNGWSSKAVAQWFKGTTTPDRFEHKPRVMGVGLGSFPTVLDIDKDGDLDVASAEFFLEKTLDKYGFAWMEQTRAPGPASPSGRWVRHVIADDLGPAIELLFVPNLLGDGMLRAVGSVHVMDKAVSGFDSSIYLFDIPADPRGPWPAKAISQGIRPSGRKGQDRAPGVLGWGDVDHDGDIDITASGDGDPRVFVLEQVQDHSFRTHAIEENLGQASGMEVGDLDKDGRAEIVVTGYENNVIYIYEWSDTEVPRSGHADKPMESPQDKGTASARRAQDSCLDKACVNPDGNTHKDCTCAAKYCVPDVNGLQYANLTRLTCIVKDCVVGDTATCPPDRTCRKIPSFVRLLMKGRGIDMPSTVCTP